MKNNFEKSVAELQPKGLGTAFNIPFSLETTCILFSGKGDSEVKFRRSASL